MLSMTSLPSFMSFSQLSSQLPSDTSLFSFDSSLFQFCFPSLFYIIYFTNSFNLIHLIFTQSNLYPYQFRMNPKQKSEQDDRMLEEFLSLRPVRAIDRMLNENSVDKVFALYNALQEKIRKNTSDLRSTLTQKYQNLIDCSNLLTTIQNFTHQIEDIEKDISRIFHQNLLEDQPSDRKNNQNLISVIEENLYRKRHENAMILSHSPQVRQLQESERFYIPYLRIQILQSLEQELITKKINHRSISETIACIKAYISGLTKQEGEELVGSGDLEEGTLLWLISDGLKAKEQKLEEGDILEIVFRCKLFSLNREQKGKREDQKISKFFHDILQLMAEHNSNDTQINRLAQIFCRNLTQIETHLSETFIVIESPQTISFRYELYEKLLSSHEFIQILEQLHHIITQHYKQAPTVSLKESFLNLWNNYYQELLTVLLDGCDPNNLLQRQEQSDDTSIPGQIGKYLVRGGPSMEKVLSDYEGSLKLLTTNLRQLLAQTESLSRTTIHSQEIIQAIKAYYHNKVSELNAKVAQTCRRLSSEPSEDNLRSIILLFFLCEQFNTSISQQGAEQSLLVDLSRSQLSWNQETIKQFSCVFRTKDSDWNIRFDTFFMAYSPSTLSLAKISIIKRIVLTLIEGMLTKCDARRATALISEWRARKEQSERQQADRKNRLADLPKSGTHISNFSKKKKVDEI